MVEMRKSLITILTILIILVVAACQSDENKEIDLDERKVNETEQAEDTNLTERDLASQEEKGNEDDLDKEEIDDEQGYMKKLLDDTYFKEVEVEVDYADDKEYMFEIDEDNNNIKAKVEDRFTDVKLHGLEAFDFIFERMEQMNVTPLTDNEKVTEKILSAFNLPKDYDEIEVEIVFRDGSKLDYEHKAR